MYALIINNEFDRWVDLKKDYPQTSFPDSLPDSSLPEGVVRVSTNAAPAPGRFQVIKQADKPIKVGDQWVLEYFLAEMGDEEKQLITAQAANTVRGQRGLELAASDWTQLPDAQVDSAIWAEYRQALRDITLQPGFPFEVEWPIKPQ